MLIKSTSLDSLHSEFNHKVTIMMWYSPTDKVEIHNIKLDYSVNIYFIGNEGSNLENVFLGKINNDSTSNWTAIYPSDRQMYSFEMDNNNIYFMLISSSVQFIVKLKRSNGVYVNAISNSETTSLWSSPSWRVILASDNSTLYASGYQYILKSDTSLLSLTKYPISNMNSIDQIVNVNSSYFYLSSSMSTYYATSMFE